MSRNWFEEDKDKEKKMSMIEFIARIIFWFPAQFYKLFLCWCEMAEKAEKEFEKSRRQW